MCEEPLRKMELQHTTAVWYSGSCTNKHDKLTDISRQVLSNSKIFGFILLMRHIWLVGSTMSWRMNGKDYGQSILGWYGQPYHVQWTAEITLAPYMAGTVNHAMNNKRQRRWSIHIRLVRSTIPRWMKWRRLATLYLLGTCAASTDKGRLRIIYLARKMPYKIHY